jgi:ABC-type multidrug transport system ATPase subunit
MTEAGSAMLKLENLKVGTNGIALLEGLDLVLNEGELVALNGPSGCGKTTLLRAISGLIDPLDGRVLLDGRNPDDIGWPSFRRRVTLVDQRPVMFDDTVRGNLERPFSYKTSGNSLFSAQRAEELLDKLRVGANRLNQDARSLSMGQQQRVAIVRALLTSPDVLLLDEPTSALDPDAVSIVEETIVNQSKDSGRAALVVTHDITQAERLCDRVLDLTPHIVRGKGEGSGD